MTEELSKQRKSVEDKSLIRQVFVLFITTVIMQYSLAQEHSYFQETRDKIDYAIEELYDVDTALYFSRQLEQWALQNKDSLALMEAYNYLGYLYTEKRNFFAGRDYLNKSIDIKKKLADSCSLAITYSTLGKTYHLESDFDDAIEYYLKSIETGSKDSSFECVYSPMINLTRLYLDLEQNDKAKKLIDTTRVVLTLVEDSMAHFRYENIIGLYFLNIEQYDSALVYFDRFLEYSYNYGTQNNLANAHNNLAIVYFNSEDYGQSEYNFIKAYEVRRRQGDTSKIMASLMNLGFFYFSLKDNEKALDFYNKGLELAKTTNSIFDLRDFYQALIDVYKTLKNKDKVIEMYEQYVRYYQKSLAKINREKIEELEAQFKFKQQKREIELAKESNQKLQEVNLRISEEKQQVKRQNYVLIVLVVLLLLSLGVLLVVFYKNKKLTTDLAITTLGNKEKTTLIKEIHHRVKNNLQIITSLLRLQSASISDPEAIEQFKSCQYRVAAMALVHEKLYQSNDLSNINLPEYVDELIRNLIASFSPCFYVKQEVRIEIEQMDLDTIIPISLIINESVTNSFKHGIGEGCNDFTITCEMTYSGADKIQMIIGDNGVGFPAGFSLAKGGALGTELIDTLVDQLNGEIVILTEKQGAFYKITFPVNKKKSRI